MTTPTRNRDQVKKVIIARFNKNVRGRTPNTSKSHSGHDGKEGHWLETRMGVKHNASNSPDLFGFEMKNDTSSKTTFGDWSPNHKIFEKGNGYGLTRDSFLKIFGSPNPLKKNRYSWSGRPTPKIGTYNDFGQILTVDTKNNILALYSFKKDKRKEKSKIVPKALQGGVITLATWDASIMKTKVEKKFNNLGWFKCIKTNGVYTKIVFGPPITFGEWIKGVKKGLIFFDSGMYQGNPRPYSQWRANNNFWSSMVTEEY